MHVLFALVTTLSLGKLYVEAYTVCAKRKFHQEECRLLKDQGWNCFLMDNILDCLEKLNASTVDLALIMHEEADLVAEHLTNIEIVGQVRPIEAQYEVTEFNLTVITNKNITQFSDLKELKICHPGYDKLKVAPYLLYTFEPKVLKHCKKTDCYLDNSNEKLLEKLCIPLEYEKNHSCKICGNDCSEITEPFNFSASCLFEGRGDVAVTTVNLAESLFQSGNFYYLTESGDTSKTLAVFGSKLWPMIVSNTEKVNKMVEEITRIFPEKVIDLEHFPEKQDPLNSYLSTIILKTQSDKIFLQKDKVRRKLKEFLEDSNAKFKCHESDDPIKWCTSSRNENDKCEWLAQVLCKYITMRNIQCVLNLNKNCSESFKDDDVDVFSTLETNIAEMDVGLDFDIIKVISEDNDEKRIYVVKKSIKTDLTNILKTVIHPLFVQTNSYKPFALFGPYRNESNLLFSDNYLSYDSVVSNYDKNDNTRTTSGINVGIQGSSSTGYIFIMGISVIVIVFLGYLE